MQIEITGKISADPRDRILAIEAVTKAICQETGQDPAEGVMMLLTAAVHLSNTYSRFPVSKTATALAGALGHAILAADGFFKLRRVEEPAPPPQPNVVGTTPTEATPVEQAPQPVAQSQERKDKALMAAAMRAIEVEPHLEVYLSRDDFEHIFQQAFEAYDNVMAAGPTPTEAPPVESQAAEMAEQQRLISIGMVIAAGVVMKAHGDDTVALEILGAAGGDSEATLRAWGVDDYDIDILRPILAAEGSAE